MTKRLPHLLTALSAVLYVLSFPPHGLAFLGWFALVPWLYRLASLQEPRVSRKALTEGFWLGFLISVGGFFWVAYVLNEFGGLPWPVAILGLLLFSVIGQLQFLAFAPIARKLLVSDTAENRWTSLLLLVWLALAFTALDWVAPKIFRDTFGHHLIAHENLRMNARWSGAYGLTFLVTFCNLALARLIVVLRERNEKSVWPALSLAAPALGASLVLIGAFWLYGSSTRAWVEREIDSSERVRLAVIQANIGDLEKFAARKGVRQARQEVIRTFFQMSDEALTTLPARPMAIVWPETAYPSSFRRPRIADELELDQSVENFARTRQIPMLFGGYDEDPPPERKDYNAFFFLGKDAGPDDLQVYHKTRLLLFGEELPFSEVFPTLRRWFPQVGNFGRGRGPEPFTLPTTPAIRAVPAICYEVLFADDMAQARRAGAQMILNITNDSWFGPLAEPQLHLALSSFRSIETGMSMLRATNTGISAVVDPAGRILQQTPIGVPTILDGQVPLVNLTPSPVERWGDYFPKLATLLTVVAAVGWLVTKGRRSNR